MSSATVLLSALMAKKKLLCTTQKMANMSSENSEKKGWGATCPLQTVEKGQYMYVLCKQLKKANMSSANSESL